MAGPAPRRIKGGNQYHIVAPKTAALSQVRRCQKMRATVATLKKKRTSKNAQTDALSWSSSSRCVGSGSIGASHSALPAWRRRGYQYRPPPALAGDPRPGIGLYRLRRCARLLLGLFTGRPAEEDD